MPKQAHAALTIQSVVNRFYATLQAFVLNRNLTFGGWSVIPSTPNSTSLLPAMQSALCVS
jgi:hypothetical protein